MKKLVVAFATLLAARGARATSFASIQPWGVVRDADLILVGRVISVEVDASIDPSSSPPYSDEQVAILEVVDVWKGNPGSYVSVHFELPAPDRYAPGRLILAFLERGESRARRWREDARAEADLDEVWEEKLRADFPDLDASARRSLRGPRLVTQTEDAIRRFESWAAGRWLEILSAQIFAKDADDVAAFRPLVIAAVEAQAAGGDDETARIDWLVSLADEPSMRSFLSGFSADQLTSDQLARLASSYARKPALGFDDLVMLDLLSGYRDSEVDRTAVAVVEAGLLEEFRPDWLVPVMHETLRRFGREESSSWTGESVGEPREIWEAARRELGIPWVPPAEAPPRRAGEQP